MQTIGVIGNGFVGHATARVWMEHADVKVYDKDPKRSTHALAEAASCDFVFICLPTPPREDGTCDTSAIDEFCRYLRRQEIDPLCIIKSTVSPGTTERIAAANPKLRIVHSPEFLTARCAVADAHVPARNIIGVPESSELGQLERHDGTLSKFYRIRFPGVPVHIMSSTESELVKLSLNSFFATKVCFFNEVRQLADKLGCEWDRVIQGVLSDGRIAHAHTKVPGPSGEFGFGGACLPKDLANFATALEANGIDAALPRTVLARNVSHRGGVA